MEKRSWEAIITRMSSETTPSFLVLSFFAKGRTVELRGVVGTGAPSVGGAVVSVVNVAEG